MASFIEMLESSFFLIISTVVLMVITLTAGSIIDWLSVWQAAQPAGIISATPTQYIFGTFYSMVCIIEGGLFVQLFLTVIRKTNYSTGESEL